jgi:AraC-like DNA-binding protein
MSPLHGSREGYDDHWSVLAPAVSADGVHVWPFDPTFPIEVRYLTSGIRRNVRPNRHDYFEVVYMCAGKGSLRVQDRVLEMRAGDLFVMGSTLYHSLEYHEGPQFTVAALFFLPDLIRADGPDSAEYLTPYLVQDSLFPHVVYHQNKVVAEVFELIQKIHAELPATSALAKLSIKTYLKMMLILLVNQYSSFEGVVETFQRQEAVLDRLQILFDYVEKNYGRSIHVSDAAGVSGVSESHFMNFFRKATGQSFMAYLNHYRIERAQLLLLTTEKSILEISIETGFCDQSYFGTVFSRLVGVTPASYRRRFRSDVLAGQNRLRLRHG